MEAIRAQRLQLSNPTTSWVVSDRLCWNPTRSSLRLDHRLGDEQRVRLFVSGFSQSMNVKNRRKSLALEVFCSYKNNNPVVEAESVDISLILKNKSEEIEPYLNGRSIYLVGMMGSGKTTVGKIISGVLGYSFYDSDKLVEQTMQGTSVAEIFKLYGESVFRDNESNALKELSAMHHLVVSTGGGAVVRPINWKYMNKGISVWLDVPLEALARRIAAVGTDSRPLLCHEKGDAYTNAFIRLTSLLEERGEAYANACVRVSLENSASKLGVADACDLTPTMIAIEAFEQIENYLKKEGNNGSKGHFS